MAQTAHSQFEQAYQLVVAINGPLARNEAWDVARELLREGVDQRHLAEQVQPLRMRLSELEQRLREQQEAERLLADFCKRQGKNFEMCIRDSGRSGSGKSTIASLITRFYDIDEGEILMDGHDLREYTLASLRNQVALVSQNVHLFNDTVANNIAYARTEQYLSLIHIYNVNDLWRRRV